VVAPLTPLLCRLRTTFKGCYVCCIHTSPAAAAAGLTPKDAIQLLLSALPSATPATAPHLAAALLQQLQLQLITTSPATATATGTSHHQLQPSWARHPLSSALLSHPATAPALIRGSCLLLLNAARKAHSSSRGRTSLQDKQQQQGQEELLRTWGALQPFFTFLLLSRGRSEGSSTVNGSSSINMSGYKQQEDDGGYAAAAARGVGVGGGGGVAAAEALLEELVRVGCVATEGLVSLLIPFLARHLVVSPVVTEADG
jgi:hypothetical protein